MIVEKRKLADLPAVYVTNAFYLGGRKYYVAASENPGEHAYIFDTEKNEKAELWTGDTGCMNVIQIPGTEKALCITKFYPIFQSKDAEICMLEPTEKGYMSPWKKTTVLHVPFVHRIGCFTAKGKNYLIICALCKDKDFTEDWSKPGAVYVASIPEDGEEWKITKMVDGLTKNHGLWIDEAKAYVTSENGVMLFDFSDYEEGEVVKPVLLAGFPTSDLCVTPDRYATIEPFHGDKSRVYDWNGNILKEYDINFGHVVWTGSVLGHDVVIVGNRGGDKSLTMYDLSSEESFVIDTDVGPTQMTVVDCGDKVEILSANHGAGTVFLYVLSK